MHFQGTPVAGGYDTADDFVGGWGGCGAGRPSREGLVGVFDTRLAIVVDGGSFGISKACCLFSLIESRMLSWRRLWFTRAASPC